MAPASALSIPLLAAASGSAPQSLDQDAPEREAPSADVAGAAADARTSGAASPLPDRLPGQGDGAKVDYRELLGWLPTWARDESASDVAVKCKEAGRTHPLDRITGPAVEEAFKSSLVIWPFYLNFPLLAYGFSTCSGEGFASSSPLLLVTYVPALLLSLFFEFRCMRRTLPAYVVVTGPFRLLGWPLSFRAWFAITGSLTLVAHMDIATSGLFLARVWKTEQCNGENISNIWAEVLQQSMLRFVPIINTLSISAIALVGYALMSAQLVYAFMFSYPIQGVPGQVLHYSLVGPTDDPTWYNTLALTKQGHGPALSALAMAARMNTVSIQEWQYSQVAKQEWASRLVFHDLMQAVGRLVVFQLMYAVIQPNIQISALALSKAVSNAPIDALSMLTVTFSLIMAFKGFVQEGNRIVTLGRMVRSAKVTKKDEALTRQDEAAKTWKSKYVLALAGVVALYCLMLSGLALAKLVAIPLCDHGVWNVNGCVRISDGH